MRFKQRLEIDVVTGKLVRETFSYYARNMISLRRDVKTALIIQYIMPTSEILCRQRSDLLLESARTMERTEIFVNTNGRSLLGSAYLAGGKEWRRSSESSSGKERPLPNPQALEAKLHVLQRLKTKTIQHQHSRWHQTPQDSVSKTTHA